MNFQSDRENYVSELQKYVDVDIYGACGSNACKMGERDSHDSCSQMAQGTYKFYLAFEVRFLRCSSLHSWTTK